MKFLIEERDLEAGGVFVRNAYVSGRNEAEALRFLAGCYNEPIHLYNGAIDGSVQYVLVSGGRVFSTRTKSGKE